MIDYVFRYDPSQPDSKPIPANAEEARLALIAGNQVFSEWMATCRLGGASTSGSQYIVLCGGQESVLLQPSDGYLAQKPFAVVLGCADARVPTEMLFGQGFNDLFVVRVAGNVLGDSVQGSIDFSLQALSASVRVLVALGHTNCGAVKGAVEAYLDPEKFWSRSNSSTLRAIFQRIFTAVRESDNALRSVWGVDAPTQPGFRETLIEMAICLNAAHSAFALRQKVEAAGIQGIDVLFGVYDIRTHQVSMPIHPVEAFSPHNVNLAIAPAHPGDFSTLAMQIATDARRRKPFRQSPQELSGGQ
jgi:carbonic anhydrase